MDPVPGPLLLGKFGNAGNLTRDLLVCSQEDRPPDHRGGLVKKTSIYISRRLKDVVLN
jgi:hypothetical protein